MPCDTKLKRNQTISQRAEEVRRAIKELDSAIMRRRVRIKVGPQGAIAFDGWTEGRDGITDACAYRRLMQTGSALTRMEIAAAEQRAGISVNRQVLRQGIHSHDGGDTWGKD